MNNLDIILKSRDITLPTKFHLVKAMFFLIVMYECESWTIKKAKCWRIDAFELWCWRRLLRAPWTARRSNQSILKEISPGCSLEGLMLKLKLQYFSHQNVKNWLIGKDPDYGKDWRQEEKGTTENEIAGLHHRLDGHEFEQAAGVGDGQQSLACCSPWGHKESDTAEWLNSTELSYFPSGSNSKESTCNSGDLGSIPGNFRIRKIPQRREWLPTPVFYPGEVHGQRRWTEDITEMPIKTTMRHYLTLVRMSIIKKQALTSASENVEKREA